MSKTQKIALILIIVLLGIFYMGARSVYYMGRYYLSYSQGSKSLEQSEQDGMYIGLFYPDKKFVELRDGRILEVNNAWVEHQFKYVELFPFFIQVKKKTNGYYLVVPPLMFKEKIVQNPLEFNYFLDLHKEDEKHTKYPGFGFQEDLGFQVYLDNVPDTIRFLVTQRGTEGWKKSVIVDSIIFRRN